MRKPARLLVGPIVLFASTQCFAQQVEEIFVTAQKRAESLQDVSVSVQVTSGETILETGTRDFGDLSRTLPAINVSKGGASDQMYIRGIGSGFNGGFEQAVGTYIDGLYVGRSRGSRSAFVDLDRIEVLKGPQTIFFGNSTIAGALDVTSASPDLDGFSGHVIGMMDMDHGEQNIEAAVNIPVADNLAIRIAVREYEMDGYVRNTFTNEDVGGTDDSFVRVSALWEPTDSFSALLKYAQGDSYQNAPFMKEVVACDLTTPPVPAGRPGTSCQVHTTLLDNQLNFQLQGAGEDFTDSEFSQTSLALTWDFDNFTVTSISGLIKNENRDVQDLDSGPFQNFTVNQYDELEQTSQEIRLASNTTGDFDWIAGLYYQSGDVGYTGSQAPYFIGNGAFQAAVTAAELAGDRLGASQVLLQEETTKSAFASATWHLSDRSRVAAGLRYIEVDKDLAKNVFWATYDSIFLSRESAVVVAAPFGGFQTPGSTTASKSWNDLLPSLTYEFDLDGNRMIYASYSAGFKAGGFDFQNRVGAAAPSFEEETVDSYELGWKSTLANNSLRLNAAIFMSDYAGVQQSVLDPNTFTFTVGNAAASSTSGLELDVDWAATDRLSVKANVTFLNSQFDEFIGACSQFELDNATCPDDVAVGAKDLSGHETTFAPSYSGLLRATYTIPLNQLTLRIQPDVYFTDGFYIQGDFDPFTFQDSFVQYGLRVALADIDESWEVALIGKNLGDEKTIFFANDLPGSPGSYVQSANRPQSVALQARYNF